MTKYQAFCLHCNGGGKDLGKAAGIRKAELEASSHSKTYGHDVTILKSS